MTITFQCEHCHKDVQAPDAAAGRTGKCPYCGQSNYIPAPATGEDEVPLAPMDEDDERHRQEEIRRLRQREKDLLKELGEKSEAPPPPSSPGAKDKATSASLHHVVVNYCLDMANGNVERTKTYVVQLR